MHDPREIQELRSMHDAVAADPAATLTLPVSFMQSLLQAYDKFTDEVERIEFERDSFQLQEAKVSFNPPPQIVIPRYEKPVWVDEHDPTRKTLDYKIALVYRRAEEKNYRVDPEDVRKLPSEQILRMVRDAQDGEIKAIRGVRGLKRDQMLNALYAALDEVNDLKAGKTA